MTHPDQLQALEKVRDALEKSRGWLVGVRAISPIDNVREALSLLPDLIARAKDGGWLPIESAPKDGIKFLAINTTYSQPTVNIVHFEQKYGKTGFWDTRGALVQPTHWQPLPTPPTQPEQPL